VVSGLVSDFGPAKVDIIEGAYATHFALSRDRVIVTVTAASVRIQVELNVVSSDDARTLEASINRLAAYDHASILASAGLSISVLSVTPASSKPGTAVNAPPSSSDASFEVSPTSFALGIGVGAAGILLILLILLIILVTRVQCCPGSTAAGAPPLSVQRRDSGSTQSVCVRMGIRTPKGSPKSPPAVGSLSDRGISARRTKSGTMQV